MNSKEIDAPKQDAESEGFSTIEASAVKRVVREGWESRLKEKGTGLEILDSHAAFMSKELNTIDYQTLCMQNIATRAKHMSRGELLAYTKVVEALTLGYKSRFGVELSGPLIVGVTMVSKDLKGAKKHFEYFISHLSSGAGLYEKKIGKEAGRLLKLNAQLAKKNSGILRFFRKNEISRLQSTIKFKQIKIKKLESRKSRYVSLTEELKTKANSATPKRPNSL